MEYILLPFKVAYRIYYFLLFAATLIILYPAFLYLLHTPDRYPYAFKLMRVFGWILLLFGGIIPRVKGRNNIPQKGGYIICPNHSSFIDIPCLYTSFNRYFVFTGKKEIEKWPLFKIFYTSGMNILVDRENANGSIKALKRMSRELDKGNPLAIFPEGTVSKTAPEMGEFKTGAFALAIQKQVPILPITFLTNWKRIQRKGLLKGKSGPGISEIINHAPVDTMGYTKDRIEELKNHVYSIINAPLKQLEKKEKLKMNKEFVITTTESEPGTTSNIAITITQYNKSESYNQKKFVS